MTGKTHRVGGMLCVLGGFTILDSKGMLLGNVSPMIQLVMMYPFALYGSVVSDLDHHVKSIPCRDIFSLAINRLLHLSSWVRHVVGDKGYLSKLLSVFDAKHRSWQTHSDLFLLAMIMLSMRLANSSLRSADAVIIRLMFMGLSLGIISHLILDMLTPEGIWCIVTTVISKVTGNRLIPHKISLVPDTKFFRTGGAWEVLIRNVMWLICLLLFLKILFSMSPYTITFLKG